MVQGLKELFEKDLEEWANQLQGQVDDLDYMEGGSEVAFNWEPLEELEPEPLMQEQDPLDELIVLNLQGGWENIFDVKGRERLEMELKLLCSRVGDAN